MGSVLRLEPGDVASGMGPAGDPVPSASPPVAVQQSASPWPAGDSHLVPCPHCGVLNGRSASTCWGCEADLPGMKLFESTAAPGLAAEPSMVAVRAPAGADAASLGSTAPVDVQHPLALSHPATLARRRTRAIVAAVAFVGLVGLIAGAYWYVSAPDFSALQVTPPPPVAARAVGVVADPEPVAPVPDGPARTQPSDATRAEGTRLAAAANEPVRGATGPKSARSATTAAPTDARGGTARATLRSATGALPKLDKPAAVRPTPAAPASCTATVASLGLCAEDSAKAAAAIPMPAPRPPGPQPEPAAQRSAPPGPCTTAVASLGLCAAAPDHAKE